MVDTFFHGSIYKNAVAVFIMWLAFGQGVAAAATTVMQYTYDPDGRVTTVVYDTGLCLIYTYDANGNRLTQSGKAVTPSQGFVWGVGVWGCAPWTAG